MLAASNPMIQQFLTQVENAATSHVFVERRMLKLLASCDQKSTQNAKFLNWPKKTRQQYVIGSIVDGGARKARGQKMLDFFFAPPDAYVCIILLHK